MSNKVNDLKMSNKVKDMKNRAYYFFNDIIDKKS